MDYTPRDEDKLREVPPVYDEEIRQKLSSLSIEELKQLSEKSGTTANSGYLMTRGDEATTEDYIEEISEVGDKAEWQIESIREYLGMEE